MDQDLQRLTSELRNERCPQRVLDEVHRRIALESRPRKVTVVKAAFIAALAVVCTLALWHRPPPEEAQRQPQAAVNFGRDRAQVAREAEGALGYIGCVLLDAVPY